MNIYLNKLSSGYLQLGLEASFQHYLAVIIDKELELQTYDPNERFIVKLENNIQIDNRRNYADIVIEYCCKEEKKLFLFELKYKKGSDGGVEPGNVASYMDICNLDHLKHNMQDVEGCYFIFMTSNAKFLEEGNTGTRVDVPMYDGYQIKKDQTYKLNAKAAVRQA